MKSGKYLFGTGNPVVGPFEITTALSHLTNGCGFASVRKWVIWRSGIKNLEESPACSRLFLLGRWRCLFLVETLVTTWDIGRTRAHPPQAFNRMPKILHQGMVA